MQMSSPAETTQREGGKEGGREGWMSCLPVLLGALTPEGMVGGAVTQHFTTNQPACLVGNVFFLYILVVFYFLYFLLMHFCFRFECADVQSS